MKIYTIAAQKGGTGKTTTAAALWNNLNKMGYKALAIDLDPQCNLTFTAGSEPDDKAAMNLSLSLLQVTQTPQGDIVRGSENYATIDSLLRKDPYTRLQKAIAGVKGNYDYIVIDTPPSLGTLTLNALAAADSVIIPLQADIYSIRGLQQLYSTITAVKESLNSKLTIAGLLLTRYNARATLSKNISGYLQEAAAELDTKVFDTTIREGIAIKEAQIQTQSIFDYAPKAKVTDDYRAFIDELLKE